jgi:hypothetical protein
MTFKFKVSFGDALECGADALHLDVVVLEEDFCDGQREVLSLK